MPAYLEVTFVCSACGGEEVVKRAPDDLARPPDAWIVIASPAAETYYDTCGVECGKALITARHEEEVSGDA